MNNRSFAAPTPASTTIRAVVLNADGSVKSDLGVVSRWDRNSVLRIWWHAIGKRRTQRRIIRHNRKGIA